ncbi:MAG: hypothetical protein AB1724_14755 [Thermodesulfobacteriota bacterium]
MTSLTRPVPCWCSMKTGRTIRR